MDFPEKLRFEDQVAHQKGKNLTEACGFPLGRINLSFSEMK